MRAIFIVVCLLCSFSNVANAKSKAKHWGVGGALGDPSGVTVKYRKNVKRSYQGTIGWDIGDSVGAFGDYLWDYPKKFQIDNVWVNFYWGIGAKIKNKDVPNDEDKLRVGARVPVGLNYYFRDPTLETFIEVVPVMNLIEKTEFEIDFGLGLRFFF